MAFTSKLQGGSRGHAWDLFLGPCAPQNSPNSIPETAHPRRQRLLDRALVLLEWMRFIEPGLLLHVRRGLASGYEGYK